MSWFIGDTETSGLGPEARIVEIALLEVDEQLRVISSAHSLIDPQIPISPSASGVHGITNADVVNEPTITEFFEETSGAGFLLAPEATLIAHNAPFDMRFLAPVMPNLKNSLCTLKLARRIYPECENHKLQTLRYYLGVTGGEAHSAMGDCEVLINVLAAMMDETGADLNGLLAMSQQKVFIPTMTFGKHKGLPIEDLPRNYVTWLLGLDNLDDNLRYSLELTFYQP